MISKPGQSVPTRHDNEVEDRTDRADLGHVSLGRKPEQAREQLLARVAALAPDLGALLRLYYRHVPVEEIADEEPANLAGMLRSHHTLAQSRASGRPAVRVFNPRPEEDGWSCNATVIQLVTDDMPYLVDSVIAQLSRSGAGVQRVVHPIVVVRREVTGELHEVLPEADPSDPPDGALAESWMCVEVDRITDPDRADELESVLGTVLNDVREVVEDTQKMIDTALQLADRLEENTSLDSREMRDSTNLLRWLTEGHFTFLGYRHNQLVGDDGSGQVALQSVLASGLGVLRGDSLNPRTLSTGPEASAQAFSGEPLVLTEASEPSTVHRPVHPYYVGVKTFDEQGRVNGEHRFLGLFTTQAMHEDVLDIPVVERRVREVIHRAGFPLESYSGQRMLEEIQNYPRTELFSTEAETLLEIITGVLALAERRKLKPFLRRDPYGRFFSCLVYLPRDRYNTRSRLNMQQVLLSELGGSSLEYSTRVGESVLARVHFIVRTDPSSQVEPDLSRLQQRLGEAIYTWDDELIDEIANDQAEIGEQEEGPRAELLHHSANELGQHYGAAFPDAYKEDFSARDGLDDLMRLQKLTGHGDLGMCFYAPEHTDTGQRRFKLYLAGQRVTLSYVLPVLQRMGVTVVDERPYQVHRDDGTECWIFDFGLRLESGELDGLNADERDALRARFESAFGAAWRGEAEVDRFNSLVLLAGLDWRQTTVLRAFAKYLRQIRVAYSQDYIEDVLLTHTSITTALVRLFEARFDPELPANQRDSRADALGEEIGRMIDEVASLDADRILRAYLGLVQATLRTNYFVRDSAGQPRPFLAFKFEPDIVAGMPEPRPKYEIFVYSPRVEGVHLRFGSVARGGLRWSDRREDFRTEILGLAKAQAVKNAVIVPVGAKGGFVVKRPPASTGDAATDRQATQNEGIACYRMFISALLELTDNLAGGQVKPPTQVVRRDSDDTYLVVAADKGTATFSDIANDVAKSYGFWLGDAFASGGSVGYDHKEMGITAKGAWESVKRHFRELDVDTQSQDFTVVGVGDMGGDVFGNGMLLSEHIRLVAAFNHMHVFIDPDPDPQRSFAERRRLFDLPRSTWDDYDRDVMSSGGGIWPRTLKSIAINAQIRTALGLDESVTQLAPNELIRAILLAPVDLFWNGGIGTYVKAGSEAHVDVGDKANDPVRVDGGELRARVVGEGGNLGLTQLGRIEFARNGGKVNTDALDNSAGVDCSDHEVNIKVLLDHLVSAGRLTEQQRNELLGDMTDDVGELVLADNYRQNKVLGVSRAHAVPMLTVHARLVAFLEKHYNLDRELEALPTAAEFKELDKEGGALTSPELATLLAHVKLGLKQELLGSELPDNEVFASRLPAYFPPALREHHADAVPAHPLRREIIATQIVNEVVDGGGISFAFRLNEEVGASATDAVRAYIAVSRIFGLPDLWADINALGNTVPTSVTDSMTLETRRLLDRAARWLLSNRPQPLATGSEISRFGAAITELAPRIGDLVQGHERSEVDAKRSELLDQGVPAGVAERVACLLRNYGLLDVTEVVELAERELGFERSRAETAELYFTLSEHLDIDRMLTSVSELERGNRWHALARLALRDDFYASLRAITLDVLRDSDPGDSPSEKIAKWEQSNSARMARAWTAMEEITRSGRMDLATLSVAARQIRSMVR